MEKIKILFVDDEEKMLNSIRRSLLNFCDPILAFSGNQALDILTEAGNIHILVADLKMPIMDGIELLSIVKEKFPKVVRILFTGHVDLEASMRAVNDCNVFRFLLKPCPVEMLKRTIVEAEKQYQLNEILFDQFLGKTGDLIKMCSKCKKIKTSENIPTGDVWEPIEIFLSKHFDLKFSHGLCPKCVDELYREELDKITLNRIKS